MNAQTSMHSAMNGQTSMLELSGDRAALPAFALPTSVLVILASALSIVAAAIHLWVIPEHLAEWWGYGTFFLGLTAAQFLYAALIVRTQRPAVLVLGLVGTVATLAMYAWSRAVAVPVGPMQGQPETVELIDMICNAAEVGLIFVLAALLGRVPQPRQDAGERSMPLDLTP